MRGRIVLFIILAAMIALVGIYAGWSTNTPKAVGEPSTATPSDSSVGSTQGQGSGSGPSRSSKAPPSKAPPSKVPPPKVPPPKVPPPKAPPPKACSSTAAAQPAAYITPSGQESETEPAAQPQEGADPVRFGRVATTPSDKTVDTSIADDRTTLTTTFSDLVVEMSGGSTECDATRSFSMTLPLTGSAEGVRLRFHASGYAFVQGKATARLTLRGGGRTKVKDFPASSDIEFVQTLELPAIPATTYQLSAVLEAHQDPGTDGLTHVNLLSVDVEII